MRFQTSRLLSPIKALMRTTGMSWVALVALFGSSLAWSAYAIVQDVMKEGPIDHSWANYFFITKMWFIFNVSAMMFLGLLEGPTWFVLSPKGAKFELFPLFSWQTPAIQQALFFWPCAFYILYAMWNSKPFFQFPAHAIASLFGQQARELVLFNSDAMVRLHVASLTN
jgi:hypothetical protein